MMEEEDVPKPKPKPMIKRLSSASQSSEQLHQRAPPLRSISFIEEDLPYRTRFWKCTLPVKVVQLVMSIMCAVLYYQGKEMMPEGPRRSMPTVIYYSFVAVNLITILDYLAIQKIPGNGVRMLGFLGGVLFMVAGTVSIDTWSKENKFGAEIQDMLLAGAILSFFNAGIYFIDTVVNCKIWLRAMCLAQ